MAKEISRSISVRLIALFVGTFALSLISAFTFTYLQVSYSLETADREAVTSRWNEIAIFLRAATNQTAMNSYLNSEEERLENFSFLIQLSDSEGKVIFFKEAGRNTASQRDKAHQSIEGLATLICKPPM